MALLIPQRGWEGYKSSPSSNVCSPFPSLLTLDQLARPQHLHFLSEEQKTRLWNGTNLCMMLEDAPRSTRAFCVRICVCSLACLLDWLFGIGRGKGEGLEMGFLLHQKKTGESFISPSRQTELEHAIVFNGSENDKKCAATLGSYLCFESSI